MLANQSFTTIRNYTTLKLRKLRNIPNPCFTTIRNYTTLKRGGAGRVRAQVLLPLGITLLSNEASDNVRSKSVLLPLGITLLSNLKSQISIMSFD